MQSDHFHENELSGFEKLEAEAKPEGEYAPDVFFKDNRQAPSVVIRQVDERKREAQRKQKEAIMKLAEQFVQVDENPVDDRRTKSIEIIPSAELSASESSTPTYIRKDTPASLARLQEIKDHKNNKLKPGKFIPRRMQAQPPKPPQQPSAAEALEEREKAAEVKKEESDEEDDELMQPRKRVKFDDLLGPGEAPPMHDRAMRYEDNLPGADRAVRQQVEAQSEFRDSVAPTFEQKEYQPSQDERLLEMKVQAEHLRLQALLNNINMKSEAYLQQKKLRDLVLASIHKQFEAGENLLETLAPHEDFLEFLFVHVAKRNEIDIPGPDFVELPKPPHHPRPVDPFTQAFHQPPASYSDMFDASRAPPSRIPSEQVFQHFEH